MRRMNASRGRPTQQRRGNQGQARQKQKRKPKKAVRLPRNAPEIELTINLWAAAEMALPPPAIQLDMRQRTGRFVLGSLAGEKYELGR